MPQATKELRAKFPGWDGEALDVIRKNFVNRGGLIYPKVMGYKPTRRENDAIDYLLQEWDYCYSPDVSQEKK